MPFGALGSIWGYGQAREDILERCDSLIARCDVMLARYQIGIQAAEPGVQQLYGLQQYQPPSPPPGISWRRTGGKSHRVTIQR